VTYGSSEGLEDAPRNTGKKLTGKESLDVLGKEGNKDDCDHHDKLRVSVGLHREREGRLTAPKIVFL
jgi:hypothetical protein